MAIFSIRHQFSGKVLHTVEVGDRKIELYAPDLRGVSLENAQLNGADLRHANLFGVCLRGARLRGAILDHANLSGADLSYTDLSGASLREANLNGTSFYPAETSRAHFYGAQFSPNSEASEYSRNAQEAICRRMRITPRSVAYKKLQRTSGWDSSPRPEIVSPPIECRGKFLRHTKRLDLFIFGESL